MLSCRRSETGALPALTLNLGYTLWETVSLFRGLELENRGQYGLLFRNRSIDTHRSKTSGSVACVMRFADRQLSAVIPLTAVPNRRKRKLRPLVQCDAAGDRTDRTDVT